MDVEEESEIETHLNSLMLNVKKCFRDQTSNIAARGFHKLKVAVRLDIPLHCVCMCKSVETDLVNCPLCVLTHFCLINILQEYRDMFSVAFLAGRKAGLE